MKKLLVANWKMNLSPVEEIRLFDDIGGAIEKKKKDFGNLEIVLCPSFLTLVQLGRSAKRTESLSLGAQDCFWEDRGAFTGEISAFDLKKIGVDFVIIGHSERRQHLKETNNMVHQKVKAVLKAGLYPIICVGETFEERQEGRKDYVVIQQVFNALEGIKPDKKDKIIIAYEPVWVIGSGQAVDPKEAEYTNRVIRQAVIDSFPFDFATHNVRFLYGGSIDEKNVEGFIEQKTIDGFLVGGASLKAKSFLAIAEKMS